MKNVWISPGIPEHKTSAQLRMLKCQKDYETEQMHHDVGNKESISFRERTYEKNI